MPLLLTEFRTKLYVDNGDLYCNEQLSLICGSVGIVLLHTRVHDGASKVKVERHFRTLKERWFYALDVTSIPSPAEFNSLLNEYMRSYNTTFHTVSTALHSHATRIRNPTAEHLSPETGWMNAF